MTLRIVLPGFSPVGMPRPRACVVGGHARLYTPSRGAAAKDSVRLAAQRAVADAGWTLAPRGVALAVSIVAEFAIPASSSRRRREADLGGPHAQKPDVDNVGKLALDSLTGIVWTDDDQVALLTVAKRWATVPSLTVEVSVYGMQAP